MLLLIQYTLIFASVLVLVALGGCFSEHGGVINIGLEGIMVIGALGGALTMKYLPAGMPAAVVIFDIHNKCFFRLSICNRRRHIIYAFSGIDRSDKNDCCCRSQKI